MGVYPGFSHNVLDTFKAKVSSFAEADRTCVLLFDEIAIKAGLSYDKVRDEVEGLEDLGSAIGTRGSFATSALIFMARGIN